MPKFRFEVSAQLANVGLISVPEEYPWFLQLLCGNCGEQTQKPVVVTSNETVDGVRGGAVNLRMTCKLCNRVSDVKILQDQMSYSEQNSPDWAPFLLLDCRGTEPHKIMLSDDVSLIILGADGFNFEDAFVNDGEFYGWDEKRNVEASVTEFRTRIVKD